MTIIHLFLLLGGIGLFLYGMRMMGDGLKQAAGNNLRNILEHTTSNPILGVLMGCGITMLIQSSSATTVMTIDFVAAGLMSLSQSFGVILGANMGTTITAEIVAFDLGSYAPILIFLGAVMIIFVKSKLAQNVGYIVMGFGMLFFGIKTMGQGIEPLKGSPEFEQLLVALNQPVLAVLVGLVFTAIVQSSSSSVGIFQTFALQGLIPYEMAVYLVIGSSLGACMPAFLAMLASNRQGKRTAIVNFLFNSFRVIFCFALVTLVPQSLHLLQSLAPNDIMRQIAHTHVALAVVSVIVVLPFSRLFCKLACKILPVTEKEQARDEKKLLYINSSFNLPSAIAISQAKHEVCRMGVLARDNLALAMDAFLELDADKAQSVMETEQTLDYLNHAITGALVAIRGTTLSKVEENQLGMMMLVVANLERIGDHAEKIAKYTNMRIDKYAKFSEVAIEELASIGSATVESVRFSLKVYQDNLFPELKAAENLENEVDRLRSELEDAHVARLMEGHCDPIAGMVYVDMISDLERCSDHAINIAYAIKGPKEV